VTTDQIGLAKLREGTELVRIGEPLRPEFAAWRYGDQFGRRRRRQMLVAGAALGALGAVVIGGTVAGVGVGSFGWMIGNMGKRAITGSPEKIVATIKTEQRGVVSVRRRHLAETTIERGRDGPIAVNLRFKGGSAQFDGEEAQRIASIVVPHANRYGGGKQSIASAVGQIESSGGPEGFLDRVAYSKWKRWRGGWANEGSTGLFGMPQVDRLALEMALHEEAERRALQGELAVLERAWREAEELAGIADNLLVPSTVQDSLDKMRGR
jgi:hypothetical protein